MARLNRKKKLESLQREKARLLQEQAKHKESRALIGEWKTLSAEIKAMPEGDPEFYPKVTRLISILSRIERLAGERITEIPDWHEWVGDLRAIFTQRSEGVRQLKRTMRMAEHKVDQEARDSVRQTGTMCAVCRHRQAQTQAYGVWLCKRCARGLDELPKGRA